MHFAGGADIAGHFLGCVDGPMSMVPKVFALKHALQIKLKAVLDETAHFLAAMCPLDQSGKRVRLLSKEIVNFSGLDFPIHFHGHVAGRINFLHRNLN